MKRKTWSSIISYITSFHLNWLKAMLNSSTELSVLIHTSWVAAISFYFTYCGKIQNSSILITSVIKENLGEKPHNTVILWIQDCETCSTHVCFSFISFCERSQPVQLTKGNTRMLLGVVCWQCCALSSKLNSWQHCQQLDISTAHFLCLLVFRQWEWTSGVCIFVLKVRTEDRGL